MRIAPALLLVSSALCSLPAWSQAQIYCCTDANGRKVCGDFLPKECQTRAYEVRDGKGYVTDLKEAPLTAEQQLRRDAELAKKQEEEKRKTEERRRNLALLSTYASDKDIDGARDRSLVDIDKLITQAEKRLGEAQAVKTKVDKDKEFYKNKTLPASLKAQMADAEAQIKAQQEVINGKKRDREAVIAKFEDERKRFHELKGDKAAPSSKPAPLTIPAAAETKPTEGAGAPKPGDKK